MGRRTEPARAGGGRGEQVKAVWPPRHNIIPPADLGRRLSLPLCEEGWKGRRERLFFPPFSVQGGWDELGGGVQAEMGVCG